MVKSGTVTNILKKIDVFGQPMYLYIKGKKLHKTREGGIITILMVIPLFFLFFYSFASLIYKKTVIIQEQTNYKRTPPLLDINRDNFMFSFGPGDPSITQKNSFFGYNLSLVTVVTEDQEEVLIIQPINFGPCHPEDFTKFADTKRIDTLTSTFCPQNYSFPIQGNEDNEIYQYINLKIIKCVNDTHANITCASNEEINQYFQEKPIVTFNIYFINRAIDAYDPNDPFKEFIDLQTWAVSPLGSLSRISSISFRTMEILSYDDIFGIKDPMTLNSIGFAQDRSDLSFIPRKNTTTFFNLNLKSSNYTKITIRAYGTILQVISFIGGIFNLLHLFLGLIAKKISNHIFEIMMANKMYSFDLSNIYEDSKESEQTAEMKDESPPPSDNENDPSYWKWIYEKKFDKVRLSRTSLIYSTFEYIKHFACCMKQDVIKKKDELFNLANAKILNDMDISVIMRKLQDIEKLKQILLTPEQLSIFNFIPSPSISMNNQQPIDKRNTIARVNSDDTILIGSGINNICDDLQQYHKHSRMYNELKKTSNSINDKLLACLNPEVREIFDYIDKCNELLGAKTDENQEFLHNEIDINQELHKSNQTKFFELVPTLSTKQEVRQQGENKTNGHFSDSICSKSTSFILKHNKINLDDSIEPSAKVPY